MNPISSAALRPVTSPAVRAAERDDRPSPAPGAASLKPVRDEYVPEEKREPCGRYWLGRDENGGPKICFDSPETAEGAPASPEKRPEEAPEEDAPRSGGPDGREERCTGNTDKADREIRKLKEKKERLEKQLSSETDEAKVRELERKLSQVESELRQKDNDAYRRRHSTFTES